MQTRVPLALCYEVSKNGKVSYLFATEHCFYKVPNEIIKLMEEKKIHNLLVENGTPPPKLKGGAQGIPYAIGLPLDNLIGLSAFKDNIPIIGLDDVTDQSSLKVFRDSCFRTDIFNYFFPELAVDLTKKRMENDKTRDNNSYLKQDMQQLFKSLRNSRRQYPELRHNIRDKRNQKWKPTIMRYLKKGKALIAVGCGHVLDYDGYVEILTAEGYTLKPYPVTIEPNVELIDAALSNPDTDRVIASYQGRAARNLLKNTFGPLDVLIRAAKHNFKTLTISQKLKLDYILNFLLKDYILKDPALLAIQVSMHSLIPYIKNNKDLNQQLKKDIEKILNQPGKENTIKAQGARRRAHFLAALFFPNLLNKDDQSLIICPSEAKEHAHQVPRIITINLPEYLRRVLRVAAENNALFLDDLSDDLIKQAIVNIEEDDVSELIYLFNKYQHASYPMFKKDCSEWQARIVLQKMLQMLAAPPYQKSAAIRVIKDFYENLIKVAIPLNPSNVCDRVKHRLALYDNLYHQADSVEEKRIEIDSKKVSDLSDKIRQTIQKPSLTTKDKQEKINGIVDDLVKLNDLLLSQPDITPDRADYLKTNLIERLHREDQSLSKHRTAWKHRLANALFSLTGIGALIIIGNYAYCGQLLWSKTNAQRKLEEIEGVINAGYSQCLRHD